MLFFAHLGLTLAGARLVLAADLAFVTLGSLLPDIIDKPLGIIVYGTPAMGRTFAHTLLFLTLLIALALYFQDIKLASLSGGVFAHLALDSMWRSPVTLMWPLLGGFPIAQELSTIDYLQTILLAIPDPWVSVPEAIGLIYLLYFGYHFRKIIAAQGRSMIRIGNPVER